MKITVEALGHEPFDMVIDVALTPEVVTMYIPVVADGKSLTKDTLLIFSFKREDLQAAIKDTK